MTQINDELDCCGINEIRSISDNRNNPEQTVIDVCKETYTEEKIGAFLLFTDINKREAGNNLAKYILKNDLGSIIKTPLAINPNSGNKLQAYIWTINKRNLKKFAKKHKVRITADEDEDSTW